MRRMENQSGQTLVALLAFMATALTITTGAVAVTVANLQSASEYSRGQRALQIAESGADNALMRLVRDPSYVGETMAVDDGTATITISGSPSYTITSVGRVGDFRRTIQVSATRSSNAVTINSWSEVP
jgi:hypothetical protein